MMATNSPLPTFNEETLFWNNGYSYVIGIDEVGKGAFAGPVVVGAVIFIRNQINVPLGIRDSKQLPASSRTRLAQEIKQSAYTYALSAVSVKTINTYGITYATLQAFYEVICVCMRKISVRKSVGIVYDGLTIPLLQSIFTSSQKALVKGDQTSITIAAASIIAKVYRDMLMQEFHRKYPLYDFFENKGYGTKKHRDMLKEIGLSPIHRKSFNLTPYLA